MHDEGDDKHTLSSVQVTISWASCRRHSVAALVTLIWSSKSQFSKFYPKRVSNIFITDQNLGKHGTFTQHFLGHIIYGLNQSVWTGDATNQFISHSMYTALLNVGWFVCVKLRVGNYLFTCFRAAGFRHKTHAHGPDSEYADAGLWRTGTNKYVTRPPFTSCYNEWSLEDIARLFHCRCPRLPSFSSW